jgi:uncharacterized protein (DUF302 family)
MKLHPHNGIKAATPAPATPEVKALAPDGLITLQSRHGPEETMERLEAAVKAKGLCVFARIDLATSATALGLPLRPTDLLVFGTAKLGAPLVQSVRTIGIDLPCKALVWQDDSGATWLSYNDPNWLAKRHGLDSRAELILRAMTGALKEVAVAATAQ